MMDDGWMWGHGWGGWLAMGLVMLIFWAGLIAAAILAIRYLGTTSRPAGPGAGGRSPGPEDVLAGRYARGEIDDEEYRRRVTVLREHRVAG